MRKGAIALMALAMLGGCHPAAPLHPRGDTNPQAELARALAILRTSTPAEPKTLKILFYGQSISVPEWTDLTARHLRVTYPNTRFIIRNMAIPGFDATSLDRAAARDIADFYPDLIVFHIYGDQRARDHIFRTMRSQTAAEIIVQTDHVIKAIEPICAEGLYWGRSPGCKGLIWHRQNNWEERVSSVLLPEDARKYGLAIDPRRWGWNAYLRRHHLKPEDLLADIVHPNAAGWALMARLFDRWFDQVAARWTPHPQNLVLDQSLPSSDEIDITGNRIELIADAPLDAKVVATVDGKAPKGIDGCWLTSRTTMLPNVDFWPALQQVGVSPAIHRAAHWSLTVRDLSPDQSKFRFTLYGPTGAPDGEGDAQTGFTSNTGDIRIDPQDWTLGWAKALVGRGVPEGFRVSWDRHFVCGDEPAVQLTPNRLEVRHVIATGLVNGPHHITLKLSAEARAAIRSIRIYRPPLAF